MNAFGWVAVVALGLGLLWLLGLFIGWCLDESSPYRSPALQQEAQNKRELQEHRAVIDALYQRAEEEVRRRAQ
jgi:energy-converting hydrogenase Eha subunit F